MPENMSEGELIDNFSQDLNALEIILAAKRKKIEELEKERNEARKYLKDNEGEHQKEIDELGKIINELTEEIRVLTASAPVHIGTLVAPTKTGWVSILDNHRSAYEVPVGPKINWDDLEEGSEVGYLINPMTSKPISVFDVRKTRRHEEVITIADVIDEKTAMAILPGDVHKLVNISRKLQSSKEKLEKGDKVYYDPNVNFVISKVPKEKKKTDSRHIEKKTWADVGGLRDQIKKVKEVVERHFENPNLFKIKGILLSGPPGCGKTLIGRVLASEINAFLILVSGPEVVSSYVGESEANLRAIFEQARKNAPSIIFFDEIEAIAEKRDDAEHGHERRLVSQLLALMDGLTSTERVIVIAATNKPNLLDEAFRRPGRFTREIEISVPDAGGRLEILQIHSKDLPLAENVSLKILAELAHGFSGADLEGLCQEALYKAFDGAVPGSFAKTKVTMEHFNTAMELMKPSIMREVSFQKPTETWEDVGGLDEIKQNLIEAVKWPLLYPELLRIAKQKPPKGVLLSGPPGCGKTLLGKALANECGVNFIQVKGPELIIKWVGESEKNVRDIFKRARQASPCIIFFDEIESLAPRRGSDSSDSGVGNKVTSALLAEIDGIVEMKGVFILAATNRLDLVDPALMSRLKNFYVPLPNEEVREKIFIIHTKGKPLAKDVDLKALAKMTKLPKGTIIEFMMGGHYVKEMLNEDAPFTGRHIENICMEATQIAMREFVATRDPEKDYPDFMIYMKHFEEALGEVVSLAKALAKDVQDLSKDDQSPQGREVERVKVIQDSDIQQVV